MSWTGPKNNDVPPFLEFSGQESFFGGKPPLSLAVGYLVVLGFGALFSIFTTLIVMADTYFGKKAEITSEHFNTAGRLVKTGLIASVIVSQWTWAATLLQSSNVAWSYGVSGPFWYASGATIQVLLFGVLAISIKKVAPSAHTFCEIVNARWGRTAHKTFLFFGLCANTVVTSMLLLGGASVTQALTGMDYRLAAFLMPWGIILYTAAGGLKATILANYIHTFIIYIVLIIMIFLVYVKVYSTDQIYDFLNTVSTYTPESCEAIWSNNGVSFWKAGKYACGPVPGNRDGSYLTMLSSNGLMFGVINIVGNFGTVFVDQSYWQSAIASRPSAAAKGYLLGGLCWFAIPFSLATSLGLGSVALQLPINSSEAGAGLVPPAMAYYLIGNSGAALILVMLFMAIVSTGSTECIAVSSLVAYDVYREYMNPEATGAQILYVSRVVIIVFGLVMGCFAILLNYIGINLGWVYLFMGVVIGSAVVPLWNLMTWKKASGTGAVIAAWGGLVLAIIGWLVAAQIQGGEITIDTLGTNEVMLSGNVVAIVVSGAIHVGYSMFIDPQDYNFDELDSKIQLVENDMSGLGGEFQDPVELQKAYVWITRRGYALTLILIFIWPLLSVPAGVFSKNYFAFWVLVAIAWGFGAALTMAVLPLTESQDDIFRVTTGMYNYALGKKPHAATKEVEDEAKDVEEVAEPTKEPFKEEETAKPEEGAVEVSA